MSYPAMAVLFLAVWISASFIAATVIAVYESFTPGGVKNINSRVLSIYSLVIGAIVALSVCAGRVI